MPWWKVMPASTSRSTAIWSSQWEVASSAIRSATGPHAGVTAASPAMPSTRPASASRSAPRTIIFDGTQP